MVGVEVAEGLASCQHLEYVEAPSSTFDSTPPDGSTTFHVLHLNLCSSFGGALSKSALWGLMARGGFPILSSLSLDKSGWVWDEGLGPATMAAFEGVAGTLKDLTISHGAVAGAVDVGEAGGVLQQVGEAIGKLHRLETLHLDIGGEGFMYHHIAQGMAKGACPALRSLTLFIEHEAVWLACRPSIILPSVQALHVTFGGQASIEPLALACALKGLEYRNFVVMTGVAREGGQRDQIRELVPQCSVRFV
jgi:hypothetical protein